MKTTLFSTLLFCAFNLFSAAVSAQTKADETALNALLKEAYAAFEAKDAHRFAAIFTDDASFIPPPGYYTKGKAAIEASHAELFKMDIKVLKTEIRSSDMRFLSPDVALYTWTEYQETEWNGQLQKGETVGSVMAVRQNGKWLTATCQLTPVMN